MFFTNIVNNQYNNYVSAQVTLVVSDIQSSFHCHPWLPLTQLLSTKRVAETSTETNDNNRWQKNVTDTSARDYITCFPQPVLYVWTVSTQTNAHRHR